VLSFELYGREHSKGAVSASPVVPDLEAVEGRRELVAARPEAFGPDLANSLTGMGIRLAQLVLRETRS
jgi:hypothetical protein